MPNEAFGTQVPPGSRTFQLTSTGKRCGAVRTFAATNESVCEFRCHSQPVQPLVLMALALPGRWNALTGHS